MAVVFEEVIGIVDPEPTSPEQEQQSKTRAVSKETSLDKLRSELSRLTQREMRLRAD